MKLIAHRGRVVGDLENSLAGINGLPIGVDGIEIDARVTADGVPILIHDSTLERVTEGGNGRIDQTLFSHIEMLKLRGVDEQIPQLEPFLGFAATRLWSSKLSAGKRSSATIYLDIKPSSTKDVAIIAEVIKRLPFRRGIVCLVKEATALETLARVGKGKLRLGLLRCNLANLHDRLEIAKKHQAEVLFVQHGLDAFRSNIGIVNEIRLAGFQAGGSVLNGKEALELADNAGCDLVLTDFMPTLSASG